MEEKLSYLYDRWLTKTASMPERQEFMTLLKNLDPVDRLSPLMIEAWQKMQEEEGLFTEEQKISLADTILAKASKP